MFFIVLLQNLQLLKLGSFRWYKTLLQVTYMVLSSSIPSKTPASIRSNLSLFDSVLKKKFYHNNIINHNKKSGYRLLVPQKDQVVLPFCKTIERYPTLLFEKFLPS